MGRWWAWHIHITARFSTCSYLLLLASAATSILMRWSLFLWWCLYRMFRYRMLVSVGTVAGCLSAPSTAPLTSSPSFLTEVGPCGSNFVLILHFMCTVLLLFHFLFLFLARRGSDCPYSLFMEGGQSAQPLPDQCRNQQHLLPSAGSQGLPGPHHHTSPPPAHQQHTTPTHLIPSAD